jgi:hypothetical protein
MKTTTVLLIRLIIFGLFPGMAVAQYPPVLNFSDLVSGPDSGLGDGQGSGTIVTLWGNFLGSSISSGKVFFTDAASTRKEAAHIYYWKNADGQLPGGPANLYESHQMQEIAFSIPDGAMGSGTISIEVDGRSSNVLPFTVRPGNIYFVHASGSNSNDCSWASPCEFIDGGYVSPGHPGSLGNGNLVAGDIVYSRGVAEPGMSGGGIDAGLFLRGVKGTALSPVSLVAYPNTRPEVSAANWGIQPYFTEYYNVSKFFIEVGYANPAAGPNAGASSATSNSHITAQKGRYIGNLMKQISGTCFTGWSGSITSSYDGGANAKIFGNHFDRLGCENSSRYQHTLYMSIRNESVSIPAWEIGHNYLDNNDVFFGIHNYDEQYTGDCGDLTGTLKIHHNVILNQRGAGINVGTNDADGAQNSCWTADVEITNNVLINVGLGVAQEDNVTNADAINVAGDLTPNSVTISNNTIYGYGETASLANDGGNAISVYFALANPTITINNNTFVQTLVHENIGWIANPGSEVISATNNSFYNTVTGDSNIPPPWSNNISSNPLISFYGSGPRFFLMVNSPLIDSGFSNDTIFDIYGVSRIPNFFDVGAVEFRSDKTPRSPSALNIR